MAEGLLEQGAGPEGREVGNIERRRRMEVEISSPEML